MARKQTFSKMTSPQLSNRSVKESCDDRLQHEKLAVLKVSLYHATDLFPSQHHFGTAQLQQKFGAEVVDIPANDSYWFTRLGKLLKIQFLGQQLRALGLIRNFDALYAPFASANTKVIVLLKLMGLVKKPIVVLVHDRVFGKPSKTKLFRAIQKRLIEQFDRMIFFSTKMKADLALQYGFGIDYAEQRFLCCLWGVDHAFYSRFTNTMPHRKMSIISSGTTSRDFETIVKAAVLVPYKVRIYCKPESYPKDVHIPPNVEILCGDFPYEQICKDYGSSAICLIPLKTTHNALGLTSLYEALALGTPVIMTKNENIDLDLERENVGFTIVGNDARDWANMINDVMSKPDLLHEMSLNCLRLAREKLDLNGMAQTLFTTFQSLKRST